MKFFGKDLRFNGKSVYHEGNKPIASDIKFSDDQTFQQKLDNGSLKGPKGDNGNHGSQGPKGNDGINGFTWRPSVDSSGNLTWDNNGSTSSPTTINIRGPQGIQGPKGDTGLQGVQGAKGDTGAKGADGLTTSVTVNGTKYNHSAGNITLPNYPTLSSLGAASSGHTHNYAGSSSNGGSANTAIKLASARTISLTGAISGSTTFDGSGNVTISTTSNIDPIITITKSLKVTSGWMDTGISGSNITENGSYIIQMLVNDGTNAGMYQEHFTGTMSWFKDATNSTDSDEIVLHKAGHSSNNRMVYLRTIRQTSGVLKLQIAASNDFIAATNIVFKFRKLI